MAKPPKTQTQTPGPPDAGSCDAQVKHLTAKIDEIERERFPMGRPILHTVECLTKILDRQCRIPPSVACARAGIPSFDFLALSITFVQG